MKRQKNRDRKRQNSVEGAVNYSSVTIYYYSFPAFFVCIFGAFGNDGTMGGGGFRFIEKLDKNTLLK
jgi:hypothetical protein